MDSPAVAQLFRGLFRHSACPSRRNLALLTASLRHARRCQHQRRTFASPRGKANTPASESHWQQRSHLLPADMSGEFEKAPMVTADELKLRRERPRRVKMLLRDFIEGQHPTHPLPAGRGRRSVVR